MAQHGKRLRRQFIGQAGRPGVDERPENLVNAYKKTIIYTHFTTLSIEIAKCDSRVPLQAGQAQRDR